MTDTRAARLFDAPCRFVCGAPNPRGLPDPHFPEIAFIGRSNAGKSSLINALVQQPGLARASVTPGRTQHFNCFLLGEKRMLVDLPGYGFAKAPKGMVDAWNRAIRAYLRGRPTLRRVCLLVDSRRGIMDSDRTMMALLDDAAVPYQVILTKADKLGKNESVQVLNDVSVEVATHAAARTEVILTSAQTKLGLEQVRAELAVA